MKRALITGALGQDGNYLTNLLTDKNYEVLGISSQSPDDITKKSDVNRLIRFFLPHEIYHLAAVHRSSEDVSPLTEEEYLRLSWQVNTDSTKYLLDAVHTFCPSSRFFYAASSHLYQNSTARRLTVDETTPFNPESVYSRTKLASVRLCDEYRRTKSIFASCGILFNHESPLRSPQFVSTKIIQGGINIKQGKTTSLVLGNFSDELDFGFSGDYVRAMYQILQISKSGNFIVATGETHSIGDFVKETFSQLSLDWTKYVVEDPSLLTRESRGVLVGDYSKLNAATDWSPIVSFTELIQLMIEANLSN